MTTALNSYATKVFAEHPIALWALDETIDYIRYIDDTNQNLNNWTAVGATVVDGTDEGSFSEVPATEPFPDLFVNGVITNASSVSFTSNLSLGESSFDLDLKSVAIGAFFVTYDNAIDIEIGYRYQHPDDTLGVYRTESRTKTVPASREWAFVSDTFNLPAEFSDLDFVIEITQPVADYEFAVNGINIGQWAEEFHVVSKGVTPSSLPSDIDLNSLSVEASPYGLNGESAYYLASSVDVYAKNSSLPLVFGAFNSTALYPNPSSEPSLIVPGFGFMNDSGQYQNFTCEFWIKARVHSFSHKRIFGPIASTDGLYIEGPFLKLMIGDSVATHFVGEWERPMLINIRVSPNNASLVVNGEDVASLELIPANITYAAKYDENENDQDWLGFYAYEEVPLIYIDAVGIYPYEVPTIASKRRWVYGQGVDVKNNLEGASSSTTLTFDNSFAKYSNTYSYPKLGRWSNGFIDNLVPDSEQLSLPGYSLPEIVFDNKTEDQWYSDLETSQNVSVFGDQHISLRPDSGWSGTNGYIKFPSLNLLTEETRALYGAFMVRSLPTTQEVLIDLVNETSGNRFTVYMENDVVSYVMRTKQTDGSFLDATVFSAGDHIPDVIFNVGFHIQRVIDYNGGALASFFGSKQKIKVFVAGNSDLNKTFSGIIFNLSFSTSKNLTKIEDEFLIKGFPTNFAEEYEEVIIYDGDTPSEVTWDQDIDAQGPDPELEDIVDALGPNPLVATDVFTHTGSYSLVARKELDNFVLDIGVDAYWEDYLPLSYFAKYVKALDGTSYLDLDFLQFNIDYPHLDIFSNGDYDYSTSAFRTYVTFQYIQDGANSSVSNFTEVPLPINGIIRPTSNWKTEKYEIIEDSVIYPPSGVDFSLLSVNIHMEFSVPGILNNPFKIRSLRLASRSLSHSKNNIGNKFGVDIYPYKKNKNYTDYKFVEPFTLYKNSVPYFYAAGSDGLRFRRNFVVDDNAGFEIPINKSSSSFFKIGALQMVLHYHNEEFSDAPIQIFEVEEKSRTIKFYARSYPDNNKRAYIYAIDSTTNSLVSGITYSINGKIVNRPTFNPERWFVLGISFDTALSFNDYIGAMRITSPMFFNNISAHQISEQDELARSAFRKWFSVNIVDEVQQDWDNWDEYTWLNVLYISQVNPTAPDIEKIYRQFVGTDKTVIETGGTLTFNNYRYAALQNIRWSKQTLTSA